jgi:1-acyl-sn-glycerol-3-phosphate acyltransferase
MKNLFGRLFSIWFALWCVILFLFVFPFQVIFSVHPATHRTGIFFNTIFSRLLFLVCFFRARVTRSGERFKGQHILVANHFSYLDIPALSLLKGSYKFLGKQSLTKIPLFGFMFKRLHVPVDRSSFKGRAESLNNSRRALEEGFDMAFFPEGGVRVHRHPKMADFKDGAFRLAVEKQLPILPVTMAFNHTIWPYNKKKLIIRPGKCHLHVHPPVWPQGTSEEEIARLREEVKDIMQAYLDKEYANRS